jgi:hypothetical protein
MIAKAAPFVLGGLFAAGLGLLFSDDEDDEIVDGDDTFSPPPGIKAEFYESTTAPALDVCDDATAQIPDDELRDLVRRALLTGTDLVGLRKLALQLESGAGAPETPDYARTALLQSAECLRARAAAIEEIVGSTSITKAAPAPLPPPPYNYAASSIPPVPSTSAAPVMTRELQEMLHDPPTPKGKKLKVDRAYETTLPQEKT